ncbi:heavy-metal-associated domain-containing protein, partial [Klebsiella michiganensis]|nr:heavy-metal-associated domain-containing protein [Klebsiella michiganensis]
ADFALRVDNGDSLDTLMDAGVQRLDKAYQQALALGQLNTDRLLATRPPGAKAEEKPTDEATEAATPTPEPSVAAGTAISVQFDTPNVGSVN